MVCIAGFYKSKIVCGFHLPFDLHVTEMIREKRKLFFIANVVMISFSFICMYITMHNNFSLFVFSVIDDTTKEIVYRDYIDISVAVATPKVKQVDYVVMLSVSA